MQYKKLLSILIVALITQLCVASDINQLLFFGNSTIEQTNNAISYTDQRLKIDNYQYRKNLFQLSQNLDWGEIQFRQNLETNSYLNKSNLLNYSNNQQNLNGIIRFKYGNINIGNHSHGFAFTFNKIQYSFLKERKKHQLLLSLNHFKVTEHFETEQFINKLQYQTDNLWLNFSCKSLISETGCEAIDFNIGNEEQHLRLFYQDLNTQYSANDVESEDFSINYQLSFPVYEKAITYSYQTHQIGWKNAYGEIKNFVDLYYQNLAANSFGLGRKILYADLEIDKYDLFYQKNWTIKKHKIYSQIDLSQISITNLTYSDYESLLFLGIPILKTRYSNIDFTYNLAQLQLSYEYELNHYKLLFNAKQIIYFESTLDNFNFQTEDEKELPEINSNPDNEIIDQSLNRFNWWNGLNFEATIQWNL